MAKLMARNISCDIPLECLSFHIVVSDKFYDLLLRFTAIPAI